MSLFTYFKVHCYARAFVKHYLSFQILAGDMSEANREACAGTTKPLINSVESLTAYALSPEFAPLPAKISEEVRKCF